jgi:hypothetical protein
MDLDCTGLTSITGACGPDRSIRDHGNRDQALAVSSLCVAQYSAPPFVYNIGVDVVGQGRAGDRCAGQTGFRNDLSPKRFRELPSGSLQVSAPFSSGHQQVSACEASLILSPISRRPQPDAYACLAQGISAGAQFQVLASELQAADCAGTAAAEDCSQARVVLGEAARSNHVSVLRGSDGDCEDADSIIGFAATLGAAAGADGARGGGDRIDQVSGEVLTM